MTKNLSTDKNVLRYICTLQSDETIEKKIERNFVKKITSSNRRI